MQSAFDRLGNKSYGKVEAQCRVGTHAGNGGQTVTTL